MRSPQLRIYHGPGETASGVEIPEAPAARRNVTLPLTDVLPLIGDAVRSERTWLGDFADDEMTIAGEALYKLSTAKPNLFSPSMAFLTSLSFTRI